MHSSIVPDNTQMSLPRCTTCCKLFHCPICPFFMPTALSRLKKHINVHLKNALTFKDKKICKCHLDCRTDGHFHCPQCEKTIIRKDTMATHLLLCNNTLAPVTSSALVSTQAVAFIQGVTPTPAMAPRPARVYNNNNLVPDRDPEARKLTDGSKNLINIGEAFSRWRDFKEKNCLSTDAEVARYLLDISQECVSLQDRDGKEESQVTHRGGEEPENRASPQPSPEGNRTSMEADASDIQYSQTGGEVDQKQPAAGRWLTTASEAQGGVFEVDGVLFEVEGREEVTFKEEAQKCDSELDRGEEDTRSQSRGRLLQEPAGEAILDAATDDDSDGSYSSSSSRGDQQGILGAARERCGGEQKEKLVLCPECGTLYSNRLQDYRKCEHNFTVRCQECGKQFVSESGLTLHRKLHSQDYTFPCRYCLQPFSTRLDKQTHEKSHRFRDEEPRYSCPDCALQFDNILVRSRHLKEHKSKIHICQVCYKEFSRGQLLERHVRRHSGVKPFKCQVCQRCFALPNQLRVHLYVHTGRRPLQCRICYKSFNYNFHLKKHITRCHGPEAGAEPGGGEGLMWWEEQGGGQVEDRKPVQQVELTFRTEWADEPGAERGGVQPRKRLGTDGPVAEEEHHSIVPEHSRPSLPRCTTCCKMFHCPLCFSFKPAPLSRLKKHIDVHLKNALSFSGKRICKCHLNCRMVGHFHCPLCKRTIIKKHDMTTHLRSCQKALAPVTSSELASTPSHHLDRTSIP